MVAKPQRQHRIAKLLAEQAVTSQAHLVDLLAAEGVQATQATVSRDLDDLGAIKVRVAGGDTVYAIPELPAEQRAPEDHLRRVLGDWVVESSYWSRLMPSAKHWKMRPLSVATIASWRGPRRWATTSWPSIVS